MSSNTFLGLISWFVELCPSCPYPPAPNVNTPPSCGINNSSYFDLLRDESAARRGKQTVLYTGLKSTEGLIRVVISIKLSPKSDNQLYNITHTALLKESSSSVILFMTALLTSLITVI